MKATRKLQPTTGSRRQDAATTSSSHSLKLSELRGGEKLKDAVGAVTGRVTSNKLNHEEVPLRATTSDPPRTVPGVHALRDLPVPASLLNSVACSRFTFELILALIDGMPRLEAEMAAARAKGAVSLARAYVVLYKLNDCLDRLYGKNKKGSGDEEDDNGKGGGGLFTRLFEQYKKELVPAALDVEGVTSIPLDEGMRVGISNRTFASIRSGMKDAAYWWLRDNGYEDCIKPSVNSSTLSSLAKNLSEEDNIDLPEDMFNVVLVPTTSVTVARGKK